jgi:hypothetical protein
LDARKKMLEKARKWPNLGHSPVICGRGTEYRNVRTAA